MSAATFASAPSAQVPEVKRPSSSLAPCFESCNPGPSALRLRAERRCPPRPDGKAQG
jgi:hypothetical protein